MQKLRDWIWNALFLDFYLDPRWTFRFKLMNLISGDTLRPTLCKAYRNFDAVYGEQDEPGMSDAVKRIRLRHGLRAINEMWEYYRK